MPKKVTLGDPYHFTVYGQMVDGFTINAKALSRRLQKFVNSQDKAKPTLAMIHGFQVDDEQALLDEPVLMLMPTAGADAKGWDDIFPGSDYLMWEMDQDDPSMELAVQEGTIAEILEENLEDYFEDDLDEEEELGSMEGGGLTMRGADGRLYFVPRQP